jgi:uncharacterized protein YbjT (DUF2867 family)
MAESVLVTGGTGTLGRLLVDRLARADWDVTVLSRRPGPPEQPHRWAVADLLTGDGVDEAVKGAGTIVHCATSSNGKKDVVAAENLIAAAERAGSAHLLYISVVGCDTVPFSYFKGKRAAELLVEGGSVPHTILRATQFHGFVEALFAAMAKLPAPVLPVPGFSYQPIAPAEVADRLAALAAAAPAGRVPDMGGPQIRAAKDLARAYLTATGKHRAIMGLRLPGAAFRAFKQGGHLTPDHAVGRTTFEQYLADRA